ncbi:MAG TPA: hypothetical protein VLC09_08340 [Polyangiaceae bacterium]|nr:hypothetical protein [Polyangiaceae bacterium]
MKPSNWLLTSLLSTSLLLGCQSEAARPDYAADLGKPGLPGSGEQTLSYPEGPYGENDPQLGDVIENLKFDGYLASDGTKLTSSREVESITFADLREAGKRYAVIHVSAFWCESCTLGALDLSENAKAVLARDGAIIELLVDGTASGSDPTFAELADWIDMGGLTVNTVAPGDERVREVFPSREHAYIIDLETMQVVWRHSGLFENPSTVDRAVSTLLSQYLL